MLDIHNKRVLIKHTAAIHSCSNLTHTQKVLFNHLLFHAYKTIAEDKYHVLSYNDIYRALGWKEGSNINDWLKEELTGLIKQAVKWNVFRKDKKQEWVASSCLADVRVKEGNVYFSFSKFLREVLSSPNLYAKIDLDAQKKLESKESLSLWEFLIEILDTKSISHNQTEWIEWKKLVLLLSGPSSSYLKSYALFKLRVLKKAIDQINANTDLEVECLEKKEGRAVKYLSFNIKRDNQIKDKSLNDVTVKTIAQDFKAERDLVLKNLQKYVSKAESERILGKYDLTAIKNALDFCNNELRKNGDKFNNPVAFFKKALEEGWVLPEVIESRLEKNKNEFSNTLESEIQNLHESEQLKIIRLSLLQRLGEAPYKSWIHLVQFEINADYVRVLSPSKFHNDWIESHYWADMKEVIAGVTKIQQIEFGTQRVIA